MKLTILVMPSKGILMRSGPAGGRWSRGQKARKSSIRSIKAFLHINGKGITNSNRSEGADIDSQDIDAAVEAARRYPDTIIGIKVRIAKNIVLDKGITGGSFHRTRKAG